MKSKKYQLCPKDLMESGQHMSVYMKAIRNVVHLVDSFDIFY